MSKVNCIETVAKEYAVQSKRSGELAVGRPVIFGCQLAEGQISFSMTSHIDGWLIDGWLIEAPQAMKLSFFLTVDGFECLMENLGEL